MTTTKTDTHSPARASAGTGTGTGTGTRPRRVYLDLTHLGRHVTGIERIAIELFENVTFEGADVRTVKSNGTLSMIFMQQIWLPLLALFHPTAQFIFPGFPPAPWFVVCRNRVVWYVHDLFLITRKADLSRKAKLYMAGPFQFAISRMKYFYVNSQKTASELKPFAANDAVIALYRPNVKNVFNLTAEDRASRPLNARPLKLVSLGTVEPRKNYAHAVAIRDALEALGHTDTELHIIGRAGWGQTSSAINAHPNVIVHGYLSSEDVKHVLEDSDIYLCTSFDEGLGLPLLEAQYAGLAVFAPDAPVFQEVLGDSGHFIDLTDAHDSAQQIAALLANADWRQTTSQAACANPLRWNALAANDSRDAQSVFVVELPVGFGGNWVGER